MLLEHLQIVPLLILDNTQEARSLPLLFGKLLSAEGLFVARVRFCGRRDATIRSKDSQLADTRRQLNDQRQQVFRLNKELEEQKRLVSW